MKIISAMHKCHVETFIKWKWQQTFQYRIHCCHRSGSSVCLQISFSVSFAVVIHQLVTTIYFCLVLQNNNLPIFEAKCIHGSIKIIGRTVLPKSDWTLQVFILYYNTYLSVSQSIGEIHLIRIMSEHGIYVMY